MPSTTINPTRMELTRLKGRLKTAQRGHKLLKDKRDELMKQFMDVVRENRALRRRVEEGLMRAHGSFTVASMVVFTGGKPDKNQYRRFKIKTPLDEANDFLSMQEVMRRRYAPARLNDERFGSKPDLIILDGGKPQLTAALAMFEEMGIDDIAICGLAKRDEELFVPWQDTGPVVLPSGSASLYLVKQVRDEAHRFAITFHRELRGKGMTASILDDVAGLGPVRKKALMKHFKSFKNLKAASLEEIKAAKVIPEEVAEELVRVLAQYNERKEEKEEQLAEDAS